MIRSLMGHRGRLGSMAGMGGMVAVTEGDTEKFLIVKVLIVTHPKSYVGRMMDGWMVLR